MTAENDIKPSLEIGSTLVGGKYTILSLIAQGGFAEVYLVVQTGTNELYAAKVLLPGRRADERAARKLVQEAITGRALRHPNLVPVFEHHVEPGLICFIMERLEGRTLRDMLQGGALPLRAAVDIALQAANGLYTLHRFDIFHRDLKPENLFFTLDRVLKVLDLGAARFEQLDLKTTRPKDVIGTALYMSPEHIAGDAVDGRSDIYSLGLVIYEMVTGSNPARYVLGRAGRFDYHAVRAYHEHKHPPPMRTLRPGLPEELEEIVTRAMAKKANERYQDAAQLSRVLSRVLQKLDQEDGKPTGTIGGAPPQRLVVDVRSDQTGSPADLSRAHTAELSGALPSRIGSVVSRAASVSQPVPMPLRNDTVRDALPAHPEITQAFMEAAAAERPASAGVHRLPPPSTFVDTYAALTNAQAASPPVARLSTSSPPRDSVSLPSSRAAFAGDASGESPVVLETEQRIRRRLATMAVGLGLIVGAFALWIVGNRLASAPDGARSPSAAAPPLQPQPESEPASTPPPPAASASVQVTPAASSAPIPSVSLPGTPPPRPKHTSSASPSTPSPSPNPAASSADAVEPKVWVPDF